MAKVRFTVPGFMGLIITLIGLLASLQQLGWLPVMSTQLATLTPVTTPSTEVGRLVSPTPLGPGRPPTPFTGDPSICGEVTRTVPEGVWLNRTQGVSVFDSEKTKGAVVNDKIRAIVADPRGLWIGYWHTDKNPANGIGHSATDPKAGKEKSWANCLPPPSTPQVTQTGTSFTTASTTPLTTSPTATSHPIYSGGYVKGDNDINALAIDQNGDVWAATDQGGVLRFNGKDWRRYTTEDGLPDNRTFGVTIDADNQVWVGTWNGIGRFDRKAELLPGSDSWLQVYQAKGPYINGPLVGNEVHAIAFDAEGNMWVGYITRGVSLYHRKTNDWSHYEKHNSDIGGDWVRGIAIQPADEKSGLTESMWVATADGGVSKFQNGRWDAYGTKDGLPSDEVQAVAIDKYHRPWVATTKGVAYLEGNKWLLYHTFSSFSIAFGASCDPCPAGNAFSSEAVWTGTMEKGLAQSRLPYLNSEDAITIIEVRHPSAIRPGDKFVPEVVVSPRAPYQLTRDRDFLLHVDEDEKNRFGAHENIQVTGTLKIIGPGQQYTFVSTKPFIAPQLPEGTDEQTYTSTWRVWMDNGFAGPPVKITFTIRREELIATATTTPAVIPTTTATVIPQSTAIRAPRHLLVYHGRLQR